MKIFNPAQIREIDNATCEAQRIDSIELMDRAAGAVSCEIISRFLPSQRIVIIAGPGNNGGDALAVARMLHEQGYRQLEVFLFNVSGELSHDCEMQRQNLIAVEGIQFTEVRNEFRPRPLGSGDVVVDGLFGSGISRPLKSGFVGVARWINESGAFVVSIDVPSGLFGEWNDDKKRRDMIHANLTLSFQFPRLSFFFAENDFVVGKWVLLDIGLDQRKMKELTTDFMLVEARSVRPLLHERLKFSGKRDYGAALLFAGSTGMYGAAVMCARAIMRSGAGLATVHSANVGLNVLQTAVPEAMFEPDRNPHFITDMTVRHDYQVVAAGPGIGTRAETIDAIESLLKNVKNPLLLDADALNCISMRPELLTLLPSKTVITPHAGEFDRLFGEHKSSEARLRTAIEMARQYNIIIVLKGHYTFTVRPTGKVYVNSTGNAGMATAGAGDVLTGVIAAFMAQGYCPEHATLIGVYVHGLAGDFAAESMGQFGMTASDIADNVGKAIRAVLNRESIPPIEG